MGIQGLLSFVKEASEPIHIKKYRGQTVAVDMYCWLHKGAFACADKLAKGEKTEQYVYYCMKFVEMLDSFGVKPILVFDGCHLPSKKEVEKSRRERRQANFQKGKQLLREGKTAEARECFTRCVNITPAMAHEVIKAARKKGMDCIVAPYEADAQLAYFNKTGIVQAVITEDSDLLAFGCKKVVLKVDKYGNGLEIDQAQFGKCKQLGDVFTEEKFRYMCILSGCDYLASLHGIGLAKACKLLRIANNPDIITVIKKMGHYLKNNMTVPEEYIEGFTRANNTFLYQLVVDPIKRKLVPLNPYLDDVDPKSLDYAGHNMGDQTALQIALGNVDINTMETIDSYNPDTCKPQSAKSRGWNDQATRKLQAPHMHSIWSKNYRPNGNELLVPKSEISPAKPCTRGIEKVISIKRLKLSSTPKRPREDDSLSDGDLLSQYSFSNSKKTKETAANCLPQQSPTEERESSLSENHYKSQTSSCKIRNRFATVLKRRNEDAGAVVVPGTRSRFFCSPEEICASDQQDEVKVIFNEMDSVRNKDLTPISPSRRVTDDAFATPASNSECEKNEEPPEPINNILNTSVAITEFPSTSRKSFSAFNWSGDIGQKCRMPSPTGGLAILQQFQRKMDSTQYKWSNISKEATHVIVQSDNQSKLNRMEHSEESKEDDCEMTNSSQSLVGISTSSGSLCSGVDSLGSSQKSRKSSDLDENNDDSTSDDSQTTSPTTASELPEKIKTIRNRVPGLCRLSRRSSTSSTKLKPMGSAKASGLSKKSIGLQKNKSATNDENNPRVQVTIRDLWKNFGFKMETEKLLPCQKPEPMSPVKDNFQTLTPETDQSILMRSQCSAVQRAIHW
uniref:Exonuclease 1 n=1 Tax=Callorhinchus milii TaxID=7868 RepID=A0A4W3K8D1_CALMI|eukprot:gi/632961244/ref/XP_007896648.1/ PREDICTED: exonuclease 1 [Callorhinchus milii]